MIATAVFQFSSETTFPGLAALLPVVGAAAIIWAGGGHKGIVTRLLSNLAPVFVGKISYSLYLWHFPFLAFATYVAVGGIGLGLKFAIIVFSFLVAVASWLFIEMPIRKGRGRFGETRAVFGAATATAVAFGCFGLAAHMADGFPGRISQPRLQILAGESDMNPDRVSCLPLADPAAVKQPPNCRFGTDGVAPEYALWGDSHAESLRVAVGDAAKRALRSGIFMGFAGCIPALGIDRNDPGCRLGNETIIEYLASKPRSTPSF